MLNRYLNACEHRCGWAGKAAQWWWEVHENGASPKGAAVLFILHVPSLGTVPEGRTQCKLKTEVMIAEKKKAGDGLRSCCRIGRS